MVRAELVVRGLVQGVFYRANTQATAARLGLGGWVRNEDDGSVRVVAEGEQVVVEALIAWCRRGPGGARVSGVEVSWGEARGEPGFRVTR